MIYCENPECPEAGYSPVCICLHDPVSEIEKLIAVEISGVSDAQPENMDQEIAEKVWQYALTAIEEKLGETNG